MRIKFFDGVWSNIDDKIVAEIPFFSSMVTMCQQDTSRPLEVDLTSLITNSFVITSSNFSNILLSRFAACSLEQLVLYILICNFLDWQAKLPQLYRNLANKLLGSPSHRRINNQDYNCITLTTENTAELNNTVRLLWKLRVRHLGQPGSVELKELQYMWWRMLADPVSLLAKLNQDLVDVNEQTKFELAKLEAENIRGLLLYCHQPLYFGAEAEHKATWFDNHPKIRLLPSFRLLMGVFEMFTNHEGESHVDNEVIQAIGDFNYQQVTEYYHELMVAYCDRYQDLLKTMYYIMYLCWCRQVQQHFHSSTDKLACDPDFDPDLYMLRFPKMVTGQGHMPATFVKYVDVIDPELEQLTEQLSTNAALLSEALEMPPPAAYQADVSRLSSMTAVAAVGAASTLGNAANVPVVKRSLAVRGMNNLSLRWKSDEQLKQLCHQFNILIVNYDRKLAIRILAYYV